jgi:hypothetical protein
MQGHSGRHSPVLHITLENQKKKRPTPSSAAAAVRQQLHMCGPQLDCTSIWVAPADVPAAAVATCSTCGSSCVHPCCSSVFSACSAVN